MQASREELERRLAKLEGDVSWMMKRYPDRNEFAQEFAGHADFIRRSAASADDAWAAEEIRRILTKFGFEPGEAGN